MASLCFNQVTLICKVCSYALLIAPIKAVYWHRYVQVRFDSISHLFLHWSHSFSLKFSLMPILCGWGLCHSYPKLPLLPVYRLMGWKWLLQQQQCCCCSMH